VTTPAQKASIDTRKGWHSLTRTLAYHVPWSLTHAANALRTVRKATGQK
jgi:hypothetical protein